MKEMVYRTATAYVENPPHIIPEIPPIVAATPTWRRDGFSHGVLWSCSARAVNGACKGEDTPGNWPVSDRRGFRHHWECEAVARPAHATRIFAGFLRCSLLDALYDPARAFCQANRCRSAVCNHDGRWRNPSSYCFDSGANRHQLGCCE